jgi:signal transduction histidine kinase
MHCFSLRYWLRILVANAAGAAALVVIAGGLSGAASWTETIRAFEVSLLFANLIGLPAALVLPNVAHRLWQRPHLWRWPLLIGVMLLVTAAGTTAGTWIGSAVGLFRVNAFWPAALRSFEQGAVITIIVGTSITAYEIVRSRLQDATVALRTKERDEADARRLASEAQLASLESRVHPHFLFNTLNTIAALIPQDAPAAERVVGQLASLLRFSLDTGALVPIEQELRVVQDYLEIERVRFGDRLRCRFHVDPTLGHVEVPRLSVQTLAENSVKYAVSPRREGGSIVVSVARDGERSISVSVADDGPGFDGASVEGHGIALVRERLHTQRGADAVLRVTRDGQWTRAEIILPMEPAATSGEYDHARLRR